VLGVMGQEEFAVGLQEGPEAALAAVGAGQHVGFQQPGEIRLRQVGRPVGAVALAADEGVERIPVVGAQLGQRRAGLGLVRDTGGDNPAPVGRRERGP
jgi:hypothetical protein